MGIPCQDAAAADVDATAEWAFAIVADGHGSERHFRSDRGARFAVESLLGAFRGVILTSAADEAAPDQLIKNWVDWAPQWVVAQWRTRVYADLLHAPPVVADNDTIEPGIKRYLDGTLERRGHRALARVHKQLENFRNFANSNPKLPEDAHLPLASGVGWDAELLGDWQAAAYGTTLLGCLVGPSVMYWFQLGDGAIVDVRDSEARYLVGPPASAIANETPSMCDDVAVREAVVGGTSVETDTPAPALMLTSDGIPNSYETIAGFFEFCVEVALQADSPALSADLRRWLPEISAKGSGDDVSLAMIWSESSDRTSVANGPKRQG